jgi:hypothetical protein
MSGPGVPDFGPVSVDLDTYNTEQAQPKPIKLDEVRLEGDDIPEHLRGKSAADAIKMTQQLTESLRLSESARIQAEAASKLMNQAPPPPPPPAPPEPEVTDEQLAELFQTDAVKAIRLVEDRTARKLNANLENRIKPLFSGGSSSQEQAARSRYAEEFQLFGDEITNMARSLPNGDVVLSNPAAWDDMISFIRGKPKNLERYIEHKNRKNSDVAAENARREQQSGVGFSASGGPTRPIPTDSSQLDSTQLEIARTMNMTPAEYIKWSKV